MSIKYEAVITSLLIVHNQKSKVVPLRLVLDDLIHVIISSASSNQSNEVLKGIWINRIESCAKKANITLQKNDWLCSWSKVERSRNQAVSTERSPSSGSSITENNNNNTTNSYTSSIPSLKTKVTEEDKNRFRRMFDSLNPNNFWVLDATKRAAAAAGPDVNPLSVEEKIASFALNSSNLHPSYSMILDVDEENWKTVFTKEELMEIQNEGSPLIRQTPDELLGLLKAIKKMFNCISSVEDIYTYAYSLPHDPTKDHLLTWWSLTLLNAANQFLCENTGTGRAGEADTMYNNWSFLSTIFRGSNIQVHGEELGSQANAFAQNAKRKISAIDEVEKAKRGRSMDGILKCGEVEYGCIEIGQNTDSTKELKDSRLKLPIVMKDMFMKLYNYAPELQSKIHIVGYNINGPSIQLLDLDSPKGYVTRIRRTLANDYPTSNKDFTARISSLARLAALGKTIVEETETIFGEFDKGLEPALSDMFFPPCFTIKARSLLSSSSTSQSNSKKSKEIQLSSTHTPQESSTTNSESS